MANSRSLPLVISILAAVTLVGCSQPAAAPAAAPSPTPAPTPSQAPPTPAPAGSQIDYLGMVIIPGQAAFSTGYTSRYGSPRTPASGRKFAWVYIKVRNKSLGDIILPLASRFSLLYLEDEFKASYGNPADFQDLFDLTGTRLAPGSSIDTGLRFDLPENAPLELLFLAFMPEGRSVSLPAASSGQDWARRPLFLWRLAPSSE